MSYTDDVKKQAEEVYEMYYAIIPVKANHFGFNVALTRACALKYCDGVLECIDKFNSNGAYCKGYGSASYMDVDVAEKFWKDVKQTLINK